MPEGRGSWERPIQRRSPYCQPRRLCRFGGQWGLCRLPFLVQIFPGSRLPVRCFRAPGRSAQV